MTWTGGCLVSLPDVFLVKYQVPEGENRPQCYKEAEQVKSNMERMEADMALWKEETTSTLNQILYMVGGQHADQPQHYQGAFYYH